MALALYRKYRPATFGEVVGQEHVTEPLRTALAAGRVNHAYLFSGPRGCGKTSSARIMARSLNCVNGPTPDPCGECNSCVGLAPNGPGSVDVVELDAASHGGVDDARELRDKAFYAPAESRYRVFIIDEAHMVTTQGFNALLKIVEEPPEHLIFIFATTEPDKVLPTIRSRTHHYPFRLIPPSSMRALLERNCAAEGVAVEPSVFPLVIRAGGGSARDTQSVMDQLLSGAGPEGVRYDRAIALLGVTDVALIDDVVDGLAQGDGSAVFGTIDRLVEAGHDPRRFASDLLDRLRDLVLLHAVPDAAERGLVSVPDDELAKMLAQRDATRPATVTRWAEILHQGLTEMRGSTAPRLLLELVTARMLLPSVGDVESGLLQRVEQLERHGPPAGGSAGPAPETRFQRPSQRAAEPAAPQPQPPAPVAPAPATPAGLPAPPVLKSAAMRSAGAPPAGEASTGRPAAAPSP
ncbi:DNA polymerase III subunit gamma and tau, partial [Actinosynnema sp. NPDC059335]|uniref:DNA polymerase III subunit gamma and tau n=1 Tax=Actinosynnema sp. NPDC059335 TaxID=3346804 RepID=UPI00366CDC29